MAIGTGVTALPRDLSGLAELVLLIEAVALGAVDDRAVGVLLAMIDAGLPVLELDEEAELGVTIGVAVPEPPVIAKKVEKIGLDGLLLATKRMAYFCVGERPAIG